MNNLERALSTFFDDAKLVAPLAAVLDHAGGKGRISYREVTEIAGDSADEVLLSGDGWRLLLPLKVEKSGAWEDRQLLCQPGEYYAPPNIVRHLIQNARKTGNWDTMTAIAEVFQESEESAWSEIPALVIDLGNQARDGQISGSKINEICLSAGLGDKVDVLIAELKAAGVMSPKLSPLAEVAKAGSPMYELNPALFIKK